MSHPIVTPLTQALAEGKLSRTELKDLMQRTDAPAFRHLAIWVLVLAATTTLVVLAWNSWLIWPAMFVQGIVMVHHFSLQHECIHYTAFRTRRYNDIAGQICGFIIMLPHRFFRYEHCDHHTFTQITGDDPELIPTPKTYREYLFYLSAIPYWRNKFTEIFRHARGRLSDIERGFIPKEEHAAVYRDARVMLGTYAALFVGMAGTVWWGLILLWVIPMLLGEPIMRFIRMTEHVGRPTVAQMYENTRTNLVSLPWRFLGWNMNYHAEHHYVSSVPFHTLPKLHEKLKDHVYVEKGGYIGAHVDILRQIHAQKLAAQGAQ